MSLDAIRAQAEAAIAALLEQARRPVERTNDGADITAAIEAARDKLRKPDTAGAIAGLDDKIAEEAAVRRQRMLPLLREKATIQRLATTMRARGRRCGTCWRLIRMTS